MIATPESAAALVRRIQEGPRSQVVYIDFETSGLDPHAPGAAICGAAVKLHGEPAEYLSLRHPDSANLPVAALHDVWRAAAAGAEIANHNLRFDVRWAAATEGLPLPPRSKCSMVAMHLDNENRLGPDGTRKSAYALKPWCALTFGPDAIADERELISRMQAARLNPKADLHKVPALWVERYACADVELVERAFTEHLTPRFQALGIIDLAQEYYAYDRLLTRMELDGMQLDRGLVERYLVEAREQEELSRLALVAERGTPAFNPGSPIQLKVWLGLADTKAWRLRAASHDDPRCARVLAWRRWQKAVGTYYEPYLEHSTPEGILRPHFGFTRTGRLTCYDPNLHATPHYGTEYKMKDCWVAPPGHFLLYADWSQAEMRGCAHYTKDPDLMRAFAEGIDIHSMVAQMLGCDRQTAKPLNYGSAYGMGPKKLSQEYGMAECDARKWLTKYHETLTGPRALYRRMETIAEERGWIRLWDGRYRRFSKDPAVRAFPHSASNSLLQGMVGAMARKAMLALQDFVYGNGGRMWIQIHDAVIFCLPLAMQRQETYNRVRAVMEDFPFRVKMTVDLGVGRSWKEASECKLPR